MKSCVLVIDRGSTNTKAVLFDEMGRELRRASVPNRRPETPQPGWVEIDLNQMWKEVCAAISGLLPLRERVEGIGVVGQGSGLYVTDAAGEPLGPGILSLDTRTEELVAHWRERGEDRYFESRTDAPLMPDKPIPLLCWMKQHQPERYRRIHRILFSKDWIKWKLTGAYSSDFTDASSAGLLDRETDSWFTEGLSRFGVPEMADKLPPLLASHCWAGAVTAKAALETGLPPGIPVVSGAHDLQTFPYGIGALSTKNLVSVIGTWGTNALPVPEGEALPGTFHHLAPGWRVAARFDGNSGAALDHMIGLLCGEDIREAEATGTSVFSLLEPRVEQTPKNSVVFLPYLSGSPLSGGAAAGFYGMRRQHDRYDLMRAVYEGIVFGHYQNILKLPGLDQVTALWLVGGGARSCLFGPMFASLTGYEVRIADVEEITARGMALNTWVGAGAYASHEEACIPAPVKRIYGPEPGERAYYQEKFQRFQTMWKAMTPVWNAENFWKE